MSASSILPVKVSTISYYTFIADPNWKYGPFSIRIARVKSIAIKWLKIHFC